MTPSYRTTKGDKTHVQSYVKRANELWHSASEAYKNSAFDACAINAIHACISLADAACIVHSGARYAGTSHDEAIQYFHDLRLPHDKFKTACRRFAQMIGAKTTSEYGGRNLTAKEVDAIFKNGERFRAFLFETVLMDFQ